MTRTVEADGFEAEGQFRDQKTAVAHENLNYSTVIDPVSECPGEPRATTPLGPETSPGPPVRAIVKWFNPIKGYGFVSLLDSSGDGILLASVLRKIGLSTVAKGAIFEVRVELGRRGIVVTEVIANVGSVLRGPPEPRPDGHQEVGAVKWYDARKRYGFIVRDGDTKDIFVHASVLQRSGVAGLTSGQRVVVDTVEGPKGPHAVLLRLC